MLERADIPRADRRAGRALSCWQMRWAVVSLMWFVSSSLSRAVRAASLAPEMDDVDGLLRNSSGRRIGNTLVSKGSQ